MNYLLVNGMLWMPVSYYLPAVDATVLIEVTEQQLRPLEHYMPGVGVNSGYIVNAPPSKFELGFAVGNPAHLVTKYIAVVDEYESAWEEFCNAGPAREWEYSTRKLPLSLELIWKGHEDLC